MMSAITLQVISAIITGMTSRYIPHSHQLPSKSELPDIQGGLRKALNTYLTLLQDHIDGQEAKGSSSVYTGVPGIALLYLYLAKLLPDSPDYTDAILTQQISLYAFQVPNTTHRVSFLETPVGMATLDICRSLGDVKTKSSQMKDTLASNLNYLRGIVQIAISAEVRDDEGCEVLYGRAGLLYALLKIRCEIKEAHKEASSLISDEVLEKVISSIIERGKLGARIYTNDCPVANKPGFMWRWHGKRYLGACHGVAGILHILLLAPRHLIEPYTLEIVNTVVFLLELQDDTGNFPSKAPEAVKSARVNDLVQWCHGASGTLIFLSLFLRSCPNALNKDLKSTIEIALEKGGDLVYQHGLLTKGLGLCHGTAGSIFALLAVSDALKKEEYMLRAVHLAHLASSHAKELVGVPDRPWSLYEGVAGICAAWGAVILCLQDRDESVLGMPGFDDLA